MINSIINHFNFVILIMITNITVSLKHVTAIHFEMMFFFRLVSFLLMFQMPSDISCQGKRLKIYI